MNVGLGTALVDRGITQRSRDQNQQYVLLTYWERIKKQEALSNSHLGTFDSQKVQGLWVSEPQTFYFNIASSISISTNFFLPSTLCCWCSPNRTEKFIPIPIWVKTTFPMLNVSELMGTDSFKGEMLEPKLCDWLRLKTARFILEHPCLSSPGKTKKITEQNQLRVGQH